MSEKLSWDEKPQINKQANEKQHVYSLTLKNIHNHTYKRQISRPRFNLFNPFEKLQANFARNMSHFCKLDRADKRMLRVRETIISRFIQCY